MSAFVATMGADIPCCSAYVCALLESQADANIGGIEIVASAVDRRKCNKFPFGAHKDTWRNGDCADAIPPAKNAAIAATAIRNHLLKASLPIF